MLYLYQIISPDGDIIGLIQSSANEEIITRIRETISYNYEIDADLDVLIDRIIAYGHTAERVFVVELS